ncbi:transcription termination factor MTERF2, chloroplastic-like [Sesamum indicum]|uniref:Transcription termination factor MTERF2, chloroplastic-like n=1 Tax=Sesamum indicum TaxID=4182 RepID=A0A6I9UJ56_SESIN|nr:transcription termination factor MTERF2, chloroplastic-like [Sesamum indicum]
MMIPLVRKSLTCLFFENSSFLRQSHASLSHYFSTKTENQTVDARKVSDFLLHKHHFSPEAASQVASVLTRLKNPEKSDSVLSFLKESGFSGTQVEKVVKYRPEFLSANLETIIKPKIKVFQDFGFSADEIAEIVSKEPLVLHCSMKNRLIPSLAVLKGLLGSNVEVAKVLKTSGWFLVIDLEKTLVPNVEFLKSCGISIEQIIRLMPIFPRFFLHKPKIMRKFVEKADEMGVDRSSGMFIYAVRVVSSMNKETWELKMKIFQNLGFSEDDILRVFRSAPMVFSVSEKKIKQIIEVLLENGKYDMSCIISNPTSLMYSVENRYKPRLQVLEALEKRNLLKNWPGFGTMHIMSDKKFFEKFVAPYLDEVGKIYTAKSVQKRR